MWIQRSKVSFSKVAAGIIGLLSTKRETEADFSMRAYPLFPKRKIHDLNQIWDFKFCHDAPAKLSAVRYDDCLPVPSAFDAFPAYAGQRGVGIYRTVVDVTPKSRSVLKVGGAGMTCDVYVDGQHLHRNNGSYTPFEVQLTPKDQVRREIVLMTDNRYDYNRCPLHENYFDFYNYGGVIRPVWLEELPERSIKNAHVRIDDIASGDVIVNVDFYGNPVDVNYRIDDGDWRSARGGEFSAKVPNPIPWSPASPELHTLTIDSGMDAITVRFGLRDICTEDGVILLNGDPIKLLGYCRHESDPRFGPVIPENLMVTDLQLLRDMGCNFIRGVHYQQDPRFLDLCDEMGFLVFSESLGWGQGEDRLSDKKFINAQLKQTKAMVKTDFNHPSIIMWGFLNEGQSDKKEAEEIYTKLIAEIKRLDPDRLVTYASNRGLNDLFLEHLDVISFNLYPGWYASDQDDACPLDEVVPTIRRQIAGLKERGLGNKPFIISEIGAGAIYGWHDPLNGYWTEEYQDELLNIVCREVVSNERINGVALWQFHDSRTYQGARALGRPRAFNNKGTFDEYRRPKRAFATVRKIFTECEAYRSPQKTIGRRLSYVY
jgi:beta-glucuronidase